MSVKKSAIIMIILFLQFLFVNFVLDSVSRESFVEIRKPCIRAGVYIKNYNGEESSCTLRIDSYGFPFISEEVHTELIGEEGNYIESDEIYRTFIFGDDIFGANLYDLRTKAANRTVFSANHLSLLLVEGIVFVSYKSLKFYSKKRSRSGNI